MVIHEIISCHVKSLIYFDQHSCRPGRSATSNLLCITLQKNFNVDVIYIDFSEAFDRLDQVISLQKLSTFEHNINILKLFESHLVNIYLFVQTITLL